MDADFIFLTTEFSRNYTEIKNIHRGDRRGRREKQIIGWLRQKS
jgi:hypothetical protein